MTDSYNTVKTITMNNKEIVKSICAICGSKKSQFLGSGLLNNALSNLAVEMHLPIKQGEYVSDGSFNNLNKYSYCGPGTKYEKRNQDPARCPARR